MVAVLATTRSTTLSVVLIVATSARAATPPTLSFL
jgi:hypothetical protein